MKNNFPSLAKIIANSQTWKDLNQSLLESGFTKRAYSDKEKLIYLIKMFWAHNNSFVEKESFPIPGRKVHQEGVNYYIHGLVHDSPFVFIPNEFKKKISDSLQSYNVICEDGFSYWIDNSESFREIEHFNFDKVNSFRLSKEPPIKNSLEDDNLYEKLTTMTLLDDLKQIRSIFFRGYLPGALTLDYYKFVGKENSISLRRYNYETKSAVEFARKKGLKELHIVVGCAHELPLEHLIKNFNETFL